MRLTYCVKIVIIEVIYVMFCIHLNVTLDLKLSNRACMGNSIKAQPGKFDNMCLILFDFILSIQKCPNIRNKATANRQKVARGSINLILTLSGTKMY